jgi:hypothetical protein
LNETIKEKSVHFVGSYYIRKDDIKMGYRVAQSRDSYSDD